MYNINVLLDRMLLELKSFNPVYCRQLDDPRIDHYYISINQNYYMVLYGVCGECDSVEIHNNNNNKCNIMTIQGIDNFVNKCDGPMYNKIIFEMELDFFNGNMDDLILYLTNSVKQIVPF